jgi:hypothetical protein
MAATQIFGERNVAPAGAERERVARWTTWRGALALGFWQVMLGVGVLAFWEL